MKRIITGIGMAAMLGIGMVIGSLATPTAQAANGKVTVEPAPGVTVSGPAERAMAAEPVGIQKPGAATSPWYPTTPAPDAGIAKGPIDPPAGAAYDAGAAYHNRPRDPYYGNRPYPEPPIEKGRLDRPYVVVETDCRPRYEPRNWPTPPVYVDETWQVIYGFAPGERERVTILFDGRTGDSYMLRKRGYDTYYWDRIPRW